jgi:hypothetical protein
MPRSKAYPVRHRNPEVSGAFGSRLHEEGFALLRDEAFLRLSASLRPRSGNKEKGNPIFNTDFSGKDTKRTQRPLPAKDAERFSEAVRRRLETALGVYGVLVRFPVWLTSKPGCKRQLLHRDFPNASLFQKSVHDPISVILPISEGAKLVVVPRSHRSAEKKRVGGKRRREDVLKPVVVDIPLGTILFFHGNLVHSGAAYERENTRIHGYVFLCGRGRGGRRDLMRFKAPTTTLPFELVNGELRELRELREFF